MRSVLLAGALAMASIVPGIAQGPCNAHPLRPDARNTCLEAAANLLKAGMDDVFAQDNAKIEAERKRYYALWPDRPGIDQAERDFLRGLRQKDAYYLALATSQTMNMVFVKAGNALAALGGDTSLRDLDRVPDNMDGGIRPYAKPLFARWVAAMRRAEDKKPSSGNALVDGAQNLMNFVAKMLHDPAANPQLLIDTLEDQSNWRTAYENARNWAELNASGLKISSFVKDPEIYIRCQMEADVTWALGQNQKDDLPDPAAATEDFYKLLVQMFGRNEVRAAAAATLQAPKNSVGGLATRTPVEVGEYVASPSPNPYYMFLTRVTKSSPRAYAIALAFDPNTLLTMQPTAAFNMKDNWQKAYSVYNQLVGRYGEGNVLNAAGRLKDIPKDSEGKIAGDRQSQPLRVWFQALLKDPHAVIPDGQVAHFRSGSYDPRWLGKPVVVRGTVAGVDLDKNGFPRYATIRFKDSRADGFVGFTPNPEILQDKYGNNFAELVGKTIEVQGDVQSFGVNAGVRILTLRQLRVLETDEAKADFRESTPPWLSASVPMPATVESPDYLAWKRFPAGTKVNLETRLLQEVTPGTDQYRRTLISRITNHLDSIDEQKAVVTATSTIFDRGGQPRASSPAQLVYPARQPAPGTQEDRQAKTTGEETLTINGKKIATRWESVARPNDPLTFTKTWRSDDVPGGLVHELVHEHTEIGGKPYRTIRETIYAPIDGVMPVLGDGTPPAGGNGGAAAPNAAPNRAELLGRYNTALSRVNRARAGLAMFQARQALPPEVAAAAARLDSESRAARLAMSAGNDAIAARNLNALEEALKVAEDFLQR